VSCIRGMACVSGAIVVVTRATAGPSYRVVDAGDVGHPLDAGAAPRSSPWPQTAIRTPSSASPFPSPGRARHAVHSGNRPPVSSRNTHLRLVAGHIRPDRLCRLWPLQHGVRLHRRVVAGGPTPARSSRSTPCPLTEVLDRAASFRAGGLRSWDAHQQIAPLSTRLDGEHSSQAGSAARVRPAGTRSLAQLPNPGDEISGLPSDIRHQISRRAVLVKVAAWPLGDPDLVCYAIGPNAGLILGTANRISGHRLTFPCRPVPPGRPYA